MASREEMFRRNRERARIEGAIGQAIQSGDPRVFPKDRFGAAIVPGSQILFRPAFDFVYTVLDVTPVLDPEVPPGHVNVKLLSETTLTLPTGHPLMQAIRIAVAGVAEPSEGAPEQPEAPAEDDKPRLVLV